MAPSSAGQCYPKKYSLEEATYVWLPQAKDKGGASKRENLRSLEKVCDLLALVLGGSVWNQFVMVEVGAS